MELSNTGLCKSYLSYKYVTRGIASLPCLYFIQWANYACLYVYLQLQFEKKAPFNGELFLNPSSAKETCLAKMEMIWLLFIRNFNITAEQRNLLINLCIGRIIEVLIIIIHDRIIYVCALNTVEPPSQGHFGPPCREVVLFSVVE